MVASCARHAQELTDEARPDLRTPNGEGHCVASSPQVRYAHRDQADVALMNYPRYVPPRRFRVHAHSTEAGALLAELVSRVVLYLPRGLLCSILGIQERLQSSGGLGDWMWGRDLNRQLLSGHVLTFAPTIP